MPDREDALERTLRRLSEPDDPSTVTVRVLRFVPERVAVERRARIPGGASVELDAQGRAYLAVDGRRLAFAATLDRLLETLELTADAIEPV